MTLHVHEFGFWTDCGIIQTELLGALGSYVRARPAARQIGYV
jgi:hypothetical protein